MDIDEFEKRTKPKAKRSRLEPFQAQIFELKAKGYANWQISEYLAENDLKVSKEAVRKFILSREAEHNIGAVKPVADRSAVPSSAPESAPMSAPAQATPDSTPAETGTEAERVRDALTNQQLKDEKYAQYSLPSNTLSKRLAQKKES